MKRRAFTLMEMMISIVLIVILTLFMYQAIWTSKRSTQTLRKHVTDESNRTKVFELIYRDVIEASRVEIEPLSNKKYVILRLQTNNSLHEMIRPYVAYVVIDKARTLVRLEASSNIQLPVSYEQTNRIRADRLMDGVEAFDVYTASQEDNVTMKKNERNASKESADGGRVATLLFYLESKHLKEPMLFELNTAGRKKE